MDAAFQELLARMHRRRQIEALTVAVSIFMFGVAIGFILSGII